LTVEIKIDSDDESDNKEIEDREESIDLSELVNIKAKILKENTKCPHIERKHYAKNMCANCYRKNGREEYASKCPHSNKKMYSKGMCQTCYLSEYHK